MSQSKRKSANSPSSIEFQSHKQRGAWTKQEDSRLRELVGVHGAGNWSMIASHLGTGRIGKQCRERYDVTS